MTNNIIPGIIYSSNIVVFKLFIGKYLLDIDYNILLV